MFVRARLAQSAASCQLPTVILSPIIDLRQNVAATGRSSLKLKYTDRSPSILQFTVLNVPQHFAAYLQ
jgi:hypothetical protein